MGLTANPHHRDEERWTGCDAGPGQGRHWRPCGCSRVSPRRTAPGRGDQVVRSRQARGPQAVLRLAAFLGACAGRPAVGGTVLWYQVSAGGATGVDHLCEVTAFHLPGGEPGSSRRHARRRRRGATPSGKEDWHGTTSSRRGGLHHRSRSRAGTAARFARL